MDLNERLRTFMDSQMSSAPVTDLGEIMDRGETIRRRRRLVVTVLPAAAIVVVVAGMVASRQLPGEPEGSVEEAVAAGAQLSMEVGALDWAVEPSDLGWSRQTLSSDGVLFALSTAPGAKWENFPNGNIPQAIYTSADGSSWTSHAVGGSWVSSIAAADGLLYAIGTAPGAEADTLTVQLGISEDLGDNFRTVSLPLELSRPSVVDTDVITAGEGVLALATSRTSLDPVSLLPPGTLEGGAEPVMLEDGIAVMPLEAAELAYETCFGGDAQACQDVIDRDATYYASWDELGVASEDVSFGETVDYSAYWSDDGEQFGRIEYPFPEGFIEQVFTVGDSAVAVVGGPGGSQLFASEDARAWRRVADQVPLGFVRTVGQTAGDLVVVSQPPDGSGFVVFRAPDLSGPWEEIPLEGLLPDALRGQQAWIGAAAVGEGGAAVGLIIEQPVAADGGNPISRLADELFPRAQDGPDVASAEQVGALILSHDLQNWSVVPTSNPGDFVDTLMFGADGTLIAQGSGVDGNGRPHRWQAVANP